MRIQIYTGIKQHSAKTFDSATADSADFMCIVTCMIVSNHSFCSLFLDSAALPRLRLKPKRDNPLGLFIKLTVDLELFPSASNVWLSGGSLFSRPFLYSSRAVGGIAEPERVTGDRYTGALKRGIFYYIEAEPDCQILSPSSSTIFPILSNKRPIRGKEPHNDRLRSKAVVSSRTS